MSDAIVKDLPRPLLDGIELTTMRLTEVTMCRIVNDISKEITETLKEKLSEDILFTLNLTDDDVQDFTPMPPTTKRPSTVSTFQDMAI